MSKIENKDIVEAARARTLKLHADRFWQFSRAGRWGTCVFCPRDPEGNAYPELCKETERYDHQLTGASLIEAYERELMSKIEAVRVEVMAYEHGVSR
jgi:hypothetical protein